MEGKTYRTTSDVIVIYEANDTEERRERQGRRCSLSRLVNPKKQKHDMGGKGRAGREERRQAGGSAEGRKEGSREEKLHKFGDSILPPVSKRSKRKSE